MHSLKPTITLEDNVKRIDEASALYMQTIQQMVNATRLIAFS